MSVSRCILVLPALRLCERKSLGECIWTEIENLARKKHLFDLGICYAVRRSVRLHADGNGLIDTNGVRNLNLATVGETGSNDVLRRIARVLGGAAVHLGRILS